MWTAVIIFPIIALYRIITGFVFSTVELDPTSIDCPPGRTGFTWLLKTSDFPRTIAHREWQSLILGGRHEDWKAHCQQQCLFSDSKEPNPLTQTLPWLFVRRGRRKLAHLGGCYLYQSIRYRRAKCASSKDARCIQGGRRSDSAAQPQGRRQRFYVTIHQGTGRAEHG